MGRHEHRLVNGVTLHSTRRGRPSAHHLKVLHDAGLITRRKKATWVYYRAVPERLAALADVIAPGRARTGATGGKCRETEGRAVSAAQNGYEWGPPR